MATQDQRVHLEMHRIGVAAQVLERRLRQGKIAQATATARLIRDYMHSADIRQDTIRAYRDRATKMT